MMGLLILVGITISGMYILSKLDPPQGFNCEEDPFLTATASHLEDLTEAYTRLVG